MTNKSLGRYGESLAKEHLTKRGYEILQTNWRYGRYGEIDIIAYANDKQILAFVEVKTRTNQKFGNPLEAVTTQQQNTIRRLAEAYLATQHPPTYPFDSVSFDLIIITPGSPPGSPPEIEHLESAF